MLAALIIVVLVLLIAFNRNSKTDATVANSKATQSLTTDNEEEGLDTADKSQSGSATSWYLITVLTLSAAANACIAIFISRHNRERIKLLKGKKYVEPEELQKTMRALSENAKALDNQLTELAQKNADTVQQLVQQAREAFTKVEKNSASHLENVEELKSAYLLMRDKLDDKDKEIKRYKEGYDTDKLLTSLEGFIKIRDRIASYAEDGKTTKDDLHRLVKIIENTITTSGAKEIEITVGDNIDDDKYLISVAVKREIHTDNPGDDGKIASIEKNGYQITGPEVSTVIRKAEIALHRYKTNK
jgi:molecular chaperone GrpE (heat shock protein)